MVTVLMGMMVALVLMMVLVLVVVVVMMVMGGNDCGSDEVIKLVMVVMGW